MPFTRRSASAAASLMAGLVAVGAGSGEPPSIDASAGAIDNSAGLIDAGGTTVVVFAPGGVAPLLFCGSGSDQRLRFFFGSSPAPGETAEAAGAAAGGGSVTSDKNAAISLSMVSMGVWVGMWWRWWR